VLAGLYYCNDLSNSLVELFVIYSTPTGPFLLIIMIALRSLLLLVQRTISTLIHWSYLGVHTLHPSETPLHILCSERELHLLPWRRSCHLSTIAQQCSGMTFDLCLPSKAFFPSYAQFLNITVHYLDPLNPLRHQFHCLSLSLSSQPESFATDPQSKAKPKSILQHVGSNNHLIDILQTPSCTHAVPLTWELNVRSLLRQHIIHSSFVLASSSNRNGNNARLHCRSLFHNRNGIAR